MYKNNSNQKLLSSIVVCCNVSLKVTPTQQKKHRFSLLSAKIQLSPTERTARVAKKHKNTGDLTDSSQAVDISRPPKNDDDDDNGDGGGDDAIQRSAQFKLTHFRKGRRRRCHRRGASSALPKELSVPYGAREILCYPI